MNKLFSNKEKVVLYLLKNINKYGHNINEIARALKISVGSAFKILKELENDNIVSTEPIGTGKYHSVNLEDEEARLLSELLLIKERKQLQSYAKLYGGDLSEFGEQALIILFGSILKGKNFNDVDVLFVTIEIKKVAEFCLEISKLRTKPVVPLIVPRDDFIRELLQEKESLLEILKTGVVVNNPRAFVELIKDAKKEAGMVQRKKASEKDNS